MDSIERFIAERYKSWPVSIDDALERAALPEEGRAEALLLRRERALSVDADPGMFEITEIEEPRKGKKDVFMQFESITEDVSERTEVDSISEALEIAWEMTVETVGEGQSVQFDLGTRQTKWFLSIHSPDGMSYTGSISFSVDSFTNLIPGFEVAFSLDYRGPDAHRSCLSVYGNTAFPSRAVAEMLFLAELDGARRKVLNGFAGRPAKN